MKSISSYADLLQKLARKGDPSAFFSLFNAQVKDLYILVRSKGMAHKQALLTILPFICKIYHTYVRSRPKEQSAAWFDRQKKAIPEIRALSNTDEFFIESIDAQGMEDFEHSAQLVLQREYSKLRDTYGNSFLVGKRLLGRLIRLSSIILIITAFLSGIFVGLDSLLKSTGSRIEIAVTLPVYVISFSLPSEPKNISTKPDTISKETEDSIGTMPQGRDTVEEKPHTALQKSQPVPVVTPPQRQSNPFPPRTASPTPLKITTSVSTPIATDVKKSAGATSASGITVTPPPATSPSAASPSNPKDMAKENIRIPQPPSAPPLSLGTLSLNPQHYDDNTTQDSEY